MFVWLVVVVVVVGGGVKVVCIVRVIVFGSSLVWFGLVCMKDGLLEGVLVVL